MTTQAGPESRGRGRAMNGGTAGDTTARSSGGGTQSPGATSRRPPGEPVQQTANGLADQAARTAEAQAGTVMAKTGETLEQVARAIRDAGQGLREERPEIAGIADTAAQRVEEASTYLREHDAREVIDATQEYARRQPVVVVAGALALGLLAGRFLRSGQPTERGTGGTAPGMSSPRARSNQAGR
jgi:ElaB/YqjD/DUF883 family membrane-anchored ribosome-binding protein